jgi:hypothetical protein
MDLLLAEKLAKRPELTGKYNVAAQSPLQEGSVK